MNKTLAIFLSSMVWLTACNEEESACSKRWRLDRKQINANALIAAGELTLTATDITEPYSLFVIPDLEENNGVFTIDFRDFHAEQVQGRSGLIVVDSTGKTIAGCAIRPGLISAVRPQLPVDFIDYKTVNGNVGKISAELLGDSVTVQISQGLISCSAKATGIPPFEFQIFLGSEIYPLSGRVSIRFSNGRFHGENASWHDHFTCNSIK